MLLVASLFAALAVAPEQAQRPTTVVRDSTPADSVKRYSPRRLPVTAEVLASAFRGPDTRALFERARRARIVQDSALNSYDAKVRQRMSVEVGIGKRGPERLVYRQESASRVQWERGKGVHVEMTGARVALPAIGGKTEREALQEVLTESGMSPIPYVPGSESLWIGDLTAQLEANERGIVNPLTVGAEAYYQFEAADSISFRLPDGKTVQLRELKIRPRAPKANLAVGSLWIDFASGQVVRAAYRLAVPATPVINVEPSDSVKISMTARASIAIVKSMLSPMSAQLSGVVIEYGLYQGRFWLPRSQSVEGVATAMFARVPIRMENAISYASVNAPLSLAKVEVDTTGRGPFRWPPAGLDSAARRRWNDSTRAVLAAMRQARADSVKAGMRTGSMRQCDLGDTRVLTRHRGDGGVPVSTRIPCNLDSLINSTDLPPSIYDDGKELFGSSESERLLMKTLSMSAQAPIRLFALPAPRMQLGPSMTRYNRVEGLSTGVLLEQQLGGGYVVTGVGRFGVADRMPNFELGVARTNLSKTITLNGYRRLQSASDWGNPLSFGASFGSFLFGRDEGFYYRATGAELKWATERGARLDWRAFAERQTSALQRTNYSVGGNFLPNIKAVGGVYAGASVRFLHEYGQSSRGFRALTDFRLEGAGGASSYGRAALDLTLSRALVWKLDGAVTLASGTSVGQLPTQRRWFLGGTETIRGQRADSTDSGNAFWMTRAEIARVYTGFRTSLFGDIGWVGDRTEISEVGRPLSGVGIGVSAFDGLIRFDVARGLYPRAQTRVLMYLGARF